MKFFATAAAVLAFATSAFAQTADFDPIYTPENGEVVPAGTTFKITWSAPAKYSSESISIHLIGGATQNTQVPLLDIASGVANSANAYEWTVDSSLGSENVYGLVFKLESNPEVFQYSNPFQISKAAGVSSSGSATTTLTATGGVKTVTLSSSSAATSTSVIVKPTTSVAPCNTTEPVHTKTVHTIQTVGYNCTTLSTVTPVVLSTGGHPAATATGTKPPPAQVTSGAERLVAGFAAVAGLFVAAVAL